MREKMEKPMAKHLSRARPMMVLSAVLVPFAVLACLYLFLNPSDGEWMNVPWYFFSLAGALALYLATALLPDLPGSSDGRSPAVLLMILAAWLLHRSGAIEGIFHVMLEKAFNGYFIASCVCLALSISVRRLARVRKMTSEEIRTSYLAKRFPPFF